MAIPADVDPKSRWGAAIRIQAVWRRALARVRIKARLDNRRKALEQHFNDADRTEAALLIQTRMRICLAKKKVEQKRRIAEAAGGGAKRDAAAVPTYCNPQSLPYHYFTFKSQPPTDDEVLDLFDAVDVGNTGFIPKVYAKAIFDRLLMDLHPGNSDDAFERALPTEGEWVTPSALYFVIVRALSM